MVLHQHFSRRLHHRGLFHSLQPLSITRIVTVTTTHRNRKILHAITKARSQMAFCNSMIYNAICTHKTIHLANI